MGQAQAAYRLLPDWYADVGPISLYFASHKLLPAKTLAFVDFVTAAFEQQQLPSRFAAVGASRSGAPNAV